MKTFYVLVGVAYKTRSDFEKGNPYRTRFYELIIIADCEESANRKAKDIAIKELRKEEPYNATIEAFIERSNPVFDYCIITDGD